MTTILISGSDTGVGKTRVTAAIARLIAPAAGTVRIIKPVETGVADAGDGDAARVARESGADRVTAHTLFSFPDPLAPLAAAQRAGERLSLERVAAAVEALPNGGARLIEGAGGLAVPLDGEGADWADLGLRLRVGFVVLVVPDRLGAINQARLVWDYARRRGLRAGIWLNEAVPENDIVREANRTGLEGCGLRPWAAQRWNEPLPEEPDVVRKNLLAVTGISG